MLESDKHKPRKSEAFKGSVTLTLTLEIINSVCLIDFYPYHYAYMAFIEFDYERTDGRTLQNMQTLGPRGKNSKI